MMPRRKAYDVSKTSDLEFSQWMKQTSNCFNMTSASKCRTRVGEITDSTMTTRRSRQLAMLYLNAIEYQHVSIEYEQSH
jgi:hypothetical protein